MVDQRDVGQWHRRTFPVCSPARLATKLMEEAIEADHELWRHGYSDTRLIRDEIADVAIVLMAIADRCGFDLQQAIDDKFARVVEKYAGHVDG